MHRVLLVILLINSIETVSSEQRKLCSTDIDCRNHGWEICQHQQETSIVEQLSNSGTCVHKGVYPLKQLEYIGIILNFLVIWFTNVAGLAGNGLIVPLSIFFFKFDTENAVALSNFSIFGSSVVRMCLTAGQPHPLKNGKGRMIDYSLVLLMMPLVILGVTAGVILNIILPNLIIIIFFVFLYIWVACVMGVKAKEQWQYEAAKQEEQVERHSGVPQNPVLLKIIKAESRTFPVDKMVMIGVLIIILIVISLLKSGDSPIGVKKCDQTYWILFGILCTFCVVFEILSIIIVKREYRLKVKHNYEFSQGDFEASKSNMLALTMFTLFGSFMAAFCGAGPGNAYVSLLISRGTDQRVAFATGNYMAMLTTFASSVLMIFYKRIRLDYALYIQVMTICGTFPGILFQDYINKKYNKSYIQPTIATFIMTFALVSMTALNVPEFIAKSQAGEPVFALKDYCQK